MGNSQRGQAGRQGGWAAIYSAGGRAGGRAGGQAGAYDDAEGPGACMGKDAESHRPAQKKRYLDPRAPIGSGRRDATRPSRTRKSPRHNKAAAAAAAAASNRALSSATTAAAAAAAAAVAITSARAHARAPGGGAAAAAAARACAPLAWRSRVMA